MNHETAPPGCGHVAECEVCRRYVLNLIWESAVWTPKERAAVKTALVHLKRVLSDGLIDAPNSPIGPESPPVDGPARTVEVSDRTGRTDPDMP